MNRKIISFIFIAALMLSVLKIVLSAKLATTGADLTQIESRSQQIEDENQVLNEQIVKLGSLTRVAAEASVLGLGPVEHLVSLVPETPIALRQSY